MKRKVAVIAFVVFLLTDAVLFIALRQHVSRDEALVVDDNTPTATTPGADGPAAANGRVSLTLADGGILAKVWRGRCVRSGQPRLELSSDLGKTFEEIALPLLTEPDPAESAAPADTVRTILLVRVESPKKITVIASDNECKARQFDTTDRGDSWTASPTIKAWYVDAAGTGVVSPGGASDPGCDILALAPFTERNAKIACSDGTIRGTDSSGLEWVGLGSLAGVKSVTFQGLRDGYAMASDDTCQVRLNLTKDAGASWARSGCIATKGDAKSIVGGASNLLALVDDEVVRSTDAGKTWDVQSAE